MQSNLARRVEKWEKLWRGHLRQATTIETPPGEEQAWSLIEQWGLDLVSDMKEAKRPLEGTRYDPDQTLSLYGPHGLIAPPGEEPEPVNSHQMVHLNSYLTAQFLLGLWKLQVINQGDRNAVKLAVDIQQSWANFHKQAVPVLIYDLLRLLGHDDDAFAFLAATKSPGRIKAMTRTEAALKREAAGRLEKKSIINTLREDLLGTVAELPHDDSIDLEVEAVTLKVNLARPLLPTTPDGIKNYYLGVKPEESEAGEGRRQSAMQRVIKTTEPTQGEVSESAFPTGFSIDDVQDAISQDPLYALLLNEEEAEEEALHARVSQIIDGLPPRQQATMRELLKGKSYAEAGGALGITPEAIKTNREGAVKNIKKKMA